MMQSFPRPEGINPAETPGAGGSGAHSRQAHVADGLPGSYETLCSSIHERSFPSLPQPETATASALDTRTSACLSQQRRPQLQHFLGRRLVLRAGHLHWLLMGQLCLLFRFYKAQREHQPTGVTQPSQATATGTGPRRAAMPHRTSSRCITYLRHQQTKPSPRSSPRTLSRARKAEASRPASASRLACSSTYCKPWVAKQQQQALSKRADSAPCLCARHQSPAAALCTQ